MKEQFLLSIAIQKGGRLGTPSDQLLKDGDFKYTISDREDKTIASDFPLKIYTVRNKDIPLMVESGDALMGITHQLPIRETRAQVISLMNLGFGACRLVVGVDQNSPVNHPSELSGATVCTSFPNITSDYFGEKGFAVKTKVREGSVELAIPERWADAIVDITSTGSSFRANRIREIATVADMSEAQLIASPLLKNIPDSEFIVQAFLREIVATLRGRNSLLFKMNVAAEYKEVVAQALPTLEAPTVSDLTDGNFALETVVPKKCSRELRERLLELGASKILEGDILKVVPDRKDPDIIDLMARIYN